MEKSRRVIEQQKTEAEDLLDNMKQQTITNELTNEQLNEQILQLREDLEEERKSIDKKKINC